jgi:regulator of replication initiation timing
MNKDVVMTENLLQKVEDKIHLLLAEVARMRKELHYLKHENATLKSQLGQHTKKLQGLVSLLNMVDTDAVSI